MFKNKFSLKHIAMMFACFTVCAVMSCGGNDDDDDGGGNGNGGGGADALKTWTRVEIPQIGQINSIAFGAGKFVIGADGRKVAVSSDNGKTWVVNSNDVVANGLIYDGTRFVAIGGSTVSYATDPSGAWTTITLSEIDGYSLGGRSIVYGGGNYIVAGYRGYYAYASSLTGTWSYGKIPELRGDGEYISYNGLAFGNGKFISSSARGKLAYTTNPANGWTIVSNHPFEDNSGGVTFGGNRFILAASGNTLGYASDAAGTWTMNARDPMVAAAFECVAFGKDLYVAAGSRIAYTNDPTKGWTAAQTQPFTLTSTGNAIAFGNDTFVAVGVLASMASEDKGLIAWVSVK